MSAGVVGATLAAFATSSPELAVAVASAIDGRPEIALGDVAGSNVANLGLILGLAVVIRPILVEKSEVRRDLPWAVLTVAAVSIMILDGRIQRFEAIVLLVAFVVWITRTLRSSNGAVGEVGVDDGVDDGVDEARPSGRQVWTRVGLGLVGLIVAGRLIVVGAEGVGERFGWSDFVVGAVLVAIATSMPEFVTVMISVVRGHVDLGVGALLGSNIFNTVFVVGVASVISEIDVAGRSVSVALVIGALAAALVWPWRRSRLGRWQGLALMSCFALHLIATAAFG